jgi:Helix-turn-helix domain
MVTDIAPRANPQKMSLMQAELYSGKPRYWLETYVGRTKYGKHTYYEKDKIDEALKEEATPHYLGPKRGRPDDKHMLTPADVAARLQISVGKVHQMMHDPDPDVRLPAINLATRAGKPRFWRIDPDEFEKWLATRPRTTDEQE